MSAEAIPESVPSASGSWPGIILSLSAKSALSGGKMIKFTAVVSPQRCHQQSCLHQHVAAKDFPGLLDAILFLRCQAFQTYSPAVEVRSGKYLYIGYQRFFLILGCHLIAVIITVFQK